MKNILGIFVENSSKAPIVEGFQRIKKRCIPNNTLIFKSNKLTINAVRAIKNHTNPKKRFSLKPNDVNMYLAASALSHLLDGWGYLSNAVNSLLCGNAGVSIHLAYYAELRAVMSFLASEGIGVFNKQHLAATNINSFECFDKYKRKDKKGKMQNTKIGTHIFAWDALEKWCRSSNKPEYKLLEIFKVRGFDFQELVSSFLPSSSFPMSSNTVKGWLLKWAFDIKKYRSDRELRNFVSYRPQTMSGFDSVIDCKQTIKRIYEIFETLSPLGDNPFRYLDTLLLTDLLTQLYATISPTIREPYQVLVEKAFADLGDSLDLSTRTHLLSTLPLNQKHIIFAEAEREETAPLPIISRAALLLRISTGCVSKLLKEALVGKDELCFVWDSYTLMNGFKDSPIPVTDFHTLWTEIEQYFSDLMIQIEHTDNNLYAIRQAAEEDISQLSQFNRVALWGL